MNMYYREITRILGLDCKQERHVIEYNSCQECGENKIFIWRSWDKGKCVKCDRHIHLEEVLELVEDEFVEDHKAAISLMTNVR